MNAPVRQFCPLCRGEFGPPDAVRTHLIADHKRSAAEADGLIARFDMAKPIPEPEAELHMYCAEARQDSSGRSRQDSTVPPETPVN
jgi:hypothetical protein